jgi:hypothetical protein
LLARESLVVKGLNSLEAAEFCRLDNASPCDAFGDINWHFAGEPKSASERRWLHLWNKHCEAVEGDAPCYGANRAFRSAGRAS